MCCLQLLGGVDCYTLDMLFVHLMMYAISIYGLCFRIVSGLCFFTYDTYDDCVYAPLSVLFVMTWVS